MKQRGWRRALKRAIDCGVAGTALVVASPVLAAVAGGIALTMGRPVIFTQERPGLGGRPFRMMKFRTMARAPKDYIGSEHDAARITPFGRFLRETSLDELPELINVLRGEMSLVGPRPLLMSYLERYSEEQARRHDVLPGLTGWAQINGRNATTWEARFQQDLWYVDHWSLALDAQILLKTVRAVLKKEGVSAEGHATMPEFFPEAAEARRTATKGAAV